MITAEIVADSVSPRSHRLTTLKLVYPKFIHGEFMTHRVFSRNASSSRAIPVARLIAEVRDDATRAGPVYWGAEQKGMQSGAELDDVLRDEQSRTARGRAKDQWRDAALWAAEIAERMTFLGVHKSIVNRLLEPFSHIRVVVSATEWDNFFGLRLHKDAQPEMRALAEAIYAARKASTPKLLQPGKWHLPFVDEWQKDLQGDEGIRNKLIKVSVARCARVSYESFETGRRSTVEEDLRLYDRLVGAQPLHASPAEHQATPGNNPSEWGNFIGWRQYRKTLPGESVAPLPEGYP